MDNAIEFGFKVTIGAGLAVCTTLVLAHGLEKLHKEITKKIQERAE